MRLPATDPQLASVHPALFKRDQLRTSIFPCFLIAFAITCGLWVTRANDVGFLEFCCAYILLLMPIIVYWRARRSRSEGGFFPVMLLVTSALAMNFGIPYFWGGRSVPSTDGHTYAVAPASITATMIMAVIALAALYWGYRSRIGQTFVLKQVPVFRNPATGLNYLRCLLVVGAILSHFNPSVGGEGSRQFLIALQVDVPIFAFAVLFHRYLKGSSGPQDKILLVLFAMNQLLLGLASGWIGVNILFGLVVLMVFFSVKRYLPIGLCILIVALVVFLQPGKDEFRARYWQGNEGNSPVTRVGDWFSMSYEKWSKALSGDQEEVNALLNLTAGRTSMLAFTSQIYEFTPGIVPFQYGRTYTFLLISLIPRAVWPDKPSGNDTNHFYQVAYRVTTVDRLNDVSMAPGLIGEAFMNFGWAGVVLVFVILGVLLQFMEFQLAHFDSGIILNCVGAVLFRRLVLIESHSGTYLGGMIQATVLILLVLSPVIVFRMRGLITSSSLVNPEEARPSNEIGQAA